jgi:CrcB protein
VSLTVIVGIGLLGGLGALARFGLDVLVSRHAGRTFPWGILVVNLTGALALGLLAGADVTGDAYLLVGTGLLGAYTTFSTWMVESRRLDIRRGAANVLVSLLAGLLAAWVGQQAGGLL